MADYDLPDDLLVVRAWEVRDIAGKRGPSKTIERKLANFIVPGKIHSITEVAEKTGMTLSNFNRILNTMPGFVKIISDIGKDTGTFFYLQEFKDMAGPDFYPAMGEVFAYGKSIPQRVVTKYVPKVVEVNQPSFVMPIPNNAVIQKMHRKHEKELQNLLESDELEDFIHVAAYLLAMKWDPNVGS